MNDVVIKLTQREAEYVKAMLATDSLKIQAVYKKREELKGLFSWKFIAKWECVSQDYECS